MIRCENCKYFELSTFHPQYGYCCRFPPQLRKDGEWVSPQVNVTRWCGEFCPKDQNDLELMMHLQDKHPDIYERVRRQIMITTKSSEL